MSGVQIRNATVEASYTLVKTAGQELTVTLSEKDIG